MLLWEIVNSEIKRRKHFLKKENNHKTVKIMCVFKKKTFSRTTATK